MRSVLLNAIIVVIQMATVLNVMAEIYEDSGFAFRVDLMNNWELDQQNDSVYFFKDTTPGKKTIMHIKKYFIDTSYNYSTHEWSRLSFAINKEFAQETGKIIYSDTSTQIKLGNLRAYELFAFYSQNVNDKKVCWAAYSRWTDKDSTGYLVSIIGDTSELKNNLSIFSSIMDNIMIYPSDAPMNISAQSNHIFKKSVFCNTGPEWIDLLGRTMAKGTHGRTNIIINKKTQQSRVKFNCIQ